MMSVICWLDSGLCPHNLGIPILDVLIGTVIAVVIYIGGMVVSLAWIAVVSLKSVAVAGYIFVLCELSKAFVASLVLCVWRIYNHCLGVLDIPLLLALGAARVLVRDGAAHMQVVSV